VIVEEYKALDHRKARIGHFDIHSKRLDDNGKILFASFVQVLNTTTKGKYNNNVDHGNDNADSNSDDDGDDKGGNSDDDDHGNVTMNSSDDGNVNKRRNMWNFDGENELARLMIIHPQKLTKTGWTFPWAKMAEEVYHHDHY